MSKISTRSAFFPPAPTFTDANLPPLVGKVYIVTGAASGVGYELAKMLYLAGGKVYIAARSVARCQGAIDRILSEPSDCLHTKSRSGKRSGQLASLVIDLADLRSVKAGAETFLGMEQRLDVLWHNAAVMDPPVGSKDALGHDLEVGTNCLAPHLLTTLLSPLLISTAQLPDTARGSVRIVWVVSLMQTAPGTMKFEADGTPSVLPTGMDNYMQSKVGAAWLAARFADQLGKHGIISLSLHPGIMRTELQRHWSALRRLVIAAVMKGPIHGAYSELYAGLSPEVTMRSNGGYAMAWGRLGNHNDDLLAGLKSKKEGGTGMASEFFSYSDKQIKEYLH